MGLAMLSKSTRPRRVVAVALAFWVIICTSALPAGAADSAEPTDLTGPSDLSLVERLVYGKTMTGTYLDRLGRLERDLFGSEQEGTIPVRSLGVQMKAVDSASQESLWMRLRAVEWRSGLPVNETHITERLAAIETYLLGEPQTGPIVSRVDRLVSLWFVGGKISTGEVVIPEGTTIELELKEEVSSETAKPGQSVRLVVSRSLIIDGALVIPAGSPAEMVITDASPAGHAFKRAKLEVELKRVKAFDGSMLSIVPEADVVDDGDQETTTHLAVGASILGLALLPPLGAAAGFLIKGNQIALEEGLVIRAALKADSPVTGMWIVPLAN
jgi:hypothetical protein